MPTRKLYDQLADVLDPKSGLPLGAGGGRDNILKDAAVALMVAQRLTADDSFLTLANRVREFIALATVPGFPGLLYREPGNVTPNSVDNLVGAAVAGSLAGDDYARRALFHAEHHRWTFSVTKPSAAFSPWLPWTWRYAKDWYGRFLGLPAFLEMAADYKPSEILELAFFETSKITQATPRGNTSDKILLWLQLELIKPVCGLPRETYVNFISAMEQMYPRGPADLLEIYYGPSHPLATNARTSWELL